MSAELSSPHFVPADWLQQLLQHSPDAIAVYDPHGCYSAVNDALTELLEHSAIDLVGKTNAALAAQTQEATLRKYWRQVEDAITTVCRSGIAETRIHPLPTATGVRFYKTTYTPLIDARGQVYQIIGISRETLAPVKAATDRGAPPSSQLAAHPDALTGVEMPGLEDASQAHLSARNSGDTPSPSQPSPELEQTKRRLDVTADQVTSMRQSAELLKLVLDNIPQYIFWKDRNSVYLGCNHRWAKMAGIDHPDAVVGLTDEDLPWTPEQKAWYVECDRRVMETDTPMLGIKQSQLQADGRLTWRETSKLPLHDAEGNVVGLLGTIEDITDRKIAEDLLKQSEAKFRKLAKQEELLNQISGQIRLSLKLDQIQQTTVREVRQLLEVDRVVIYGFEADWQGQVLVEDVVEPWSSILGQSTADDCFPAQYAELYLQGRVRAIADVETEELDDCHADYLRGLNVRANLIVPILVHDALWGLLIAHQCSGTRQWQEDEIELMQALAGQVGVAIQQAELYQQATRSAANAQEKAQQLEKAMQDLQQTQAQLVQTEKMSSLGQLVAGVAHEINNPVNFIYGNIPHLKEYFGDLLQLLNLYQQHYPNPDAEIVTQIEEMELDYLLEDLDKILQSCQLGAKRIQQIVMSLRTFSRLDEADKKAVNLHEGLDSTLLILHHRLKEKPDKPGIEVVKEYANLPPVECYPSQLNQVFMNLISNAIDALEQHVQETTEADWHPQIILVTEQQDNWVIIRVRDNGPGIPESIRSKLFDPFFTTKPTGKGTGLGLSISYQIVVDKHSGRLSCAADPGHGTEFQVAIPIGPQSRA